MKQIIIKTLPIAERLFKKRQLIISIDEIYVHMHDEQGRILGHLPLLHTATGRKKALQYIKNIHVGEVANQVMAIYFIFYFRSYKRLLSMEE